MCMKPTMTEEERILALEEKVARLQFDVYAMQNKIALKEDCDECPHAKCLYDADRKTEPQLTPNYCGTCKYREVPCGDLPCDVCHGYSNYEPKTEQTERSER